MSIIGIDIGNKTSKVCLLKNNNFKVIESSNNNRSIPTAITFYNKTLYSRFFGDDAISKIISSGTTSTLNLKHKLFNNNYYVDYDKEYYFKGYELYIMYVNYIYSLIVKHDDNDHIYMVSYPDYYNTKQIKFIKETYKYSKLGDTSTNTSTDTSGDTSTDTSDDETSIKYIPESISIGLEYGIYKANKGIFHKNKLVLFINIGHYDIGFFLINFTNKKMMIENTWYLHNSGAYYFDKLFTNYIINKLEDDSRYDGVSNNEKAIKRLLIESEKIRKDMNMILSSSHNNHIKLMIESFHNGHDLNIKIFKDEYNNIFTSIFASYTNVLKIFLKNYNIDSIELLGGFSHYVQFKKIIVSITNIQYRTTLNAIETISRGSCLYGCVINKSYKNINYDINYKFNKKIYMVVNGKKYNLVSNKYIPYDGNFRLCLNIKNIKLLELFIYSSDFNIPIYGTKLKLNDDRIQINMKYQIDINQTFIINKLVVGHDSYHKKIINNVVLPELYIKKSNKDSTNTLNKMVFLEIDMLIGLLQNNKKKVIEQEKNLELIDLTTRKKLELLNYYEQYIYNNVDTKHNIDKLMIISDLHDWFNNYPYKTYDECVNKCKKTICMIQQI